MPLSKYYDCTYPYAINTITEKDMYNFVETHTLKMSA